MNLIFGRVIYVASDPGSQSYYHILSLVFTLSLCSKREIFVNEQHFPLESQVRKATVQDHGLFYRAIY